MTRHHWRFLACNLVVLVVVGLLDIASVQTAKPFGEWTLPVNLGEDVNSGFEEFLPELSKNGLSLYFASNRPGPFDGEDLWVSRRESRDAPWGEPVNLGPSVNTGANERSPALSRDGHLLFFATNRAGGAGGIDIWVSWRAHTRDDLGWQPAVNLGPGVNSPGGDFGPSYFENDDIGVPTLFFAEQPPGRPRGGRHLSQRAPAGRLVRACHGDSGAQHIAERFSPHNPTRWARLIFDSSRPAPTCWTGLRNLWVSTRASVSAPWSTPESLGSVVNGVSNDMLAALSSDGGTLVFTSDRPEGSGAAIAL